MTNPKPKILIVDDNEGSRKTTSFLIEQQFGYQACSPESPDELKKAIAFEAFDSALVDFDLNDWRDKLEHYKLDHQTVKNGNDIANFYRHIHDVSIVSVYTTKSQEMSMRHKSKDITYISLPKLVKPDLESFKRNLQPFLDETDSARKLVPSFLSAAFHEGGIPNQLQHYKQMYRMNERWVDFNFEVVGDYSWAIVCDRKIEKDYGKALNGNGDSVSKYDLVIRDAYPSEEELAGLAHKNDSASFVLWNTRNHKVVEKQLELAGPNLEHIPEYLRDFFSLAIARKYADAYQTRERETLKKCRSLTSAGHIEMLKRIYKSLERGWQRTNFQEQCKEFRLPVIIEIYKATIDEIDESSGVAWVELVAWDDSIPTAGEPIELRKLQEHGVKYEDQEFEYTVYETYTNDEATNIEFIAAHKRNPFNSLLPNGARFEP